MRFLWAFRYNPLRAHQRQTAAWNHTRGIAFRQFRAHNQAVAILDKIAWSATMHSALRAVHVFITHRLPPH
ncbi:MAG: hypothetical protein LBK13_00020, partial [Spirochaetales bacterium]|nr:hypothetical protein [Spirochaetales bacterium]